MPTGPDLHPLPLTHTTNPCALGTNLGRKFPFRPLGYAFFGQHPGTGIRHGHMPKKFC